MTHASVELAVLLPELLLLAGAVAALLAGSYLPRERQGAARLLAAAALAGAAVAGAVAALGADRLAYAGTYAVDGATATARVLAPAAALLVLWLATGRVRGDRRESEFAVLVVLATLGSVLLAGAHDLLVLAVAYLLATSPLYGLAGFGRDRGGAEAALKLYLLGAGLGVTLLGGVAVLFGLGGATAYAALGPGLADAPGAALAAGTVALLAGLLFKAGAFPAHFWVPDAAAGATVPAAAFLTTVPKIGALVALYRVVELLPARVDGTPLLAVLAAAGMTLGNLAAFAQRDPLRLLGWSTVSQVGYLLLAVAAAGHPGALRGLLFYLVAYAVTNLGAFAVAAARPELRDVADYRGLGRAHPWLAGALAVCLLSLVGTPPSAGFLGKLTVFSAAWDAGLGWLVAVAAANTVASLFYYLRWLAPALTPPRPGAGGTGAAGVAGAADRWAGAAGVAAAVAVLALGVGAGPVLGALPGGVAG